MRQKWTSKAIESSITLRRPNGKRHTSEETLLAGLCIKQRSNFCGLDVVLTMFLFFVLFLQRLRGETS